MSVLEWLGIMSVTLIICTPGIILWAVAENENLTIVYFIIILMGIMGLWASDFPFPFL